MGKTRGVHETTPEIRNRMVGMYEAGLGLREIAAALNCSQRTVKRWLNRFDKEGSVETRDRCGRKRATTEEQDAAIIQLATQTPIKAAKAVLPVLGLNCSVDTIRERLHKAGIHNWNPSKKNIQKFPVDLSDEVNIQPVWRPTGTQLGKKKVAKEINKDKTKAVPLKKKSTSKKNKSKKSNDCDKMQNDNMVQSEEQPNFSFSFSQQNEPTQSQMNEVQPLPPALPPPPLSPIQQPTHPVIPNINPSQYSHPLNLMPQSQSIYHHHPGLNISQNWSLDLLQSAHHFMQGQHNSFHHDQHSALTLQSHLQIHSHHDSQVTSHVNDNMEPFIRSQHQNISQETLDKNQIQQHEDLSELSQEKLNESQDIIINVCSDACSNSNCSSNNNSQNSSMDDENSDSNFNVDRTRKKKTSKKKKGGKIKGTLETSVEIRNRMIGMSEAGLSTLSIALAINRSERTVKRWLDRWRKEGNVQTKERKGRKRITTKEEDDAIVAMATQQPLIAAKHVVPALGLQCSVDTIRERLHKAGIHSWKLGKKQGEGNTVPLQVWQPSGNRCSKVKLNKESLEKNKKSHFKKRCLNSNITSKKKNKEDKEDETVSKVNTSSDNIVSNPDNVHYEDEPQSSPVMQQPQNFLNPTSVLSQIQQHNQIPSIYPQCSMPTQTLQNMGQQPPADCRLALSTIIPQIPNQTNSSIAYSSCMMGGGTHTGHMEQNDPVNYEPYIWSF